jgi:hypothetical protein
MWIPESTGGAHVYLANIVCSNSKFDGQCKKDSNGMSIGNPCIMNLGKCIQNKDPNLQNNVGPQVPNQANYFSEPRPYDVLLSMLTSSSLQRSILLYSIAISLLLSLCAGLYLSVAGSRSIGFVVFVGLCSGMPHLWTFFGSIYPAVNCAFLLAISLASTSLLRKEEKLSNRDTFIIAFLAVSSFYLSSGSRFDLYLAAIGVLSVSTISVLLNRNAFHRKNWIATITVHAICWLMAFLNRIKGGTQQTNMNVFLKNEHGLAEEAEVNANMAKGLIETGSLIQRVWNAATAPVYYFLDWTYPYSQRRSLVTDLLTLLLIGCVIFLLTFGVSWKRIRLNPLDLVSNMQFPLFVSLLILPMSPSSGKLRLRMTAILLLPLILVYLGQREVKARAFVWIFRFFLLFNLTALIPRVFGQSHFGDLFNVPDYLIVLTYLLGISSFYSSTMRYIRLANNPVI